MDKRYTDYNTYLRRIFGCRVQKISIDAGLTCPNRDGRIGTGGCIYCNARGSGTGAFAQGIPVAEQVVRSKALMARRYKATKYIAYFQSFSNTYAPVSVLKRLYDEALTVPGVVGLAIGTRPDCVDGEILDLLESYANRYLVWIEYGLQSVHDQTLRQINRGHDFDCFQKAVALTQNRGIKICSHLILGLPGETGEMMLNTAETIARMGIDGVKLHLMYVVKGTALETLYQQGHYRCMEQQEYVDIVCDVLELLPEEMVIQRLTGDPHPQELVAPIWSLQKTQTFLMIQKTLENRNSRQGKNV
ncbi:MAG: TIGR01212 family radical SAM protein [Deltaproteobacteria bacterium]|nr:TIGR01212 family radical SAM protein [Deltaproteobacteria bacterium]